MTDEQARTQDGEVEARVREMQAGSRREEHFQVLYRRYYKRAVALALNQGFPRTEADDLAQEALVRVFNSLDSFRFESSFETWFHQIALNVVRNAKRSKGSLEGRARKVPVDEVVSDDSGNHAVLAREPRDPRQNPLDDALADERVRVLYEALQALPPKMRACAKLKLLDNLKNQEIADAIGVGVATVKTHWLAAKQRLQPILAPYFDMSDL